MQKFVMLSILLSVSALRAREVISRVRSHKKAGPKGGSDREIFILGFCLDIIVQVAGESKTGSGGLGEQRIHATGVIARGGT